LRNTTTFQWRRHDHSDNYYLPTNSQMRRLFLALDVGQELLGTAAHLGGKIGRLESTLEIGPRHFVGTETVIEDAQLQAHARYIAVDQQHALERRDRAFEIAGLACQRRELEQHIEIGRLRQHPLEGGVILALEIARRGGRRRCRTLRERKVAAKHSGQASCNDKNSPNQFH
jgi:hypothetical protein